MKLNRKDVAWLLVVIVIAFLMSSLLQTQRPLGTNLGGNPLALAVREDRSSPVEGSAGSDVTIIVFTDYRCPACRAAHPGMKRAIAKDGNVRIVYKDWPVFGEASERAAMVAIASNYQNLYPVVHDRLMTGPTDSEQSLRAAVELSGGDWRQLQRDLVSNNIHIVTQIERNKLQAFQLGLGGTPGYLIGPILVRGALSESEFTRIFRQSRKRH